MVRPPSAFVGWTKIDKSDELLDCENASWAAIAPRDSGVLQTMMCVGMAGDHAGFELITALVRDLTAHGYKVGDFGAHDATPGDDYRNYVVPLARAIAAGQVERGIAVCGSGAGAASPPIEFVEYVRRWCTKSSQRKVSKMTI